MPDALSSFAVIKKVDVRWGDMDAFNHVNNVVYIQYFETVRVAHLLHLKNHVPADSSFDAAAFMEGPTSSSAGVGPILASTSCKYLCPVQYPDELLVGSKVERIDGDRFFMKYAVWSTTLERLCAVGDGLVVTYDYETQSKCPVPPALASAIDLQQQIGPEILIR